MFFFNYRIGFQPPKNSTQPVVHTAKCKKKVITLERLSFKASSVIKQNNSHENLMILNLTRINLDILASVLISNTTKQ